MQKYQYIYCPHCGEIIEKIKEENIFYNEIGVVKSPKPYRCMECKREYIIQIRTEGILIIELKEV